jgi:uncharacterized protein YqcC (DUF446 family)
MLEDLLQAVECELQRLDLWEQLPPSDHALASDAPFAVDCLTPVQWLQWVFIAKMRLLLANDLALPKDAAIAAYFEYWAMGQHGELAVLLNTIRRIDSLLNAD